jgi:hypothetical protein
MANHRQHGQPIIDNMGGQSQAIAQQMIANIEQPT